MSAEGGLVLSFFLFSSEAVNGSVDDVRLVGDVVVVASSPKTIDEILAISIIAVLLLLRFNGEMGGVDEDEDCEDPSTTEDETFRDGSSTGSIDFEFPVRSGLTTGVGGL